MGIITLTICSFLLGKELKNLSTEARNKITKQDITLKLENKIDLNKIIWASLGFYVGILI